MDVTKSNCNGNVVIINNIENYSWVAIKIRLDRRIELNFLLTQALLYQNQDRYVYIFLLRMSFFH